MYACYILFEQCRVAFINNQAKKLTSLLVISLHTRHVKARSHGKYRIYYLCEKDSDNNFSCIQLLSWPKATTCKCPLMPVYVQSVQEAIVFVPAPSATTGAQDSLVLAFNAQWPETCVLRSKCFRRPSVMDICWSLPSNQRCGWSQGRPITDDERGSWANKMAAIIVRS